MKEITNVRSLLRSEYYENVPKNAHCQTVLDYYELLKAIKELADFVPLELIDQNNENNRAQISIRMDVDNDCFSALHCARVDAALDIPSVYYFLPTANYYGTWTYEGVERNESLFELLLYIQNILGREIGYHDDCISLLKDFNIEPAKGLKTELDYWRNAGLNVTSVTSHGSAIHHGVGSYEVWENQTIEGRKEASLNGQKIQLGHLKLSDFGFDFDGNMMNSVSWKDTNDENGSPEKIDVLDVKFDYHLFIGSKGQCLLTSNSDGKQEEFSYSIQGICDRIKQSGENAKWVFKGHPQYFGKQTYNIPNKEIVKNYRPTDWPEKHPKKILTHLIGRSRAALKALSLLGNDSLRFHPAVIKSRLIYYSDLHNEGVYWKHNRPGIHYMANYVSKCSEWIQSLSNDPKNCSILDIAGGCGNLGLFLSQLGYTDYTLNDIEEQRLAWSKDFFDDFGFELKSQGGDFRYLETNRTYDFVSLLGWENFQISYQEALDVVYKLLNKNGFLLMSFIEYDEYFSGQWETGYIQWHDNLESKKPGRYYIELHSLLDLIKKSGFEIHSWDAGHVALVDGGSYPQYLIAARKMKD